jgi:hypothetical protein
MPTTERAIYRSSKGDQWYLVEEPGSERIFVRHQPNRASGGQSSLVEVADFLSEGHGPQHEALLRLLGNVQMDWTVELHPDDSEDAKVIDLPNFEAVLACIKEHKEKGFLGTLGVHARLQPTDEERAAVIVAGGMPMWADHGLGSN